MEKQEILRYVDHTLLSPTATEAEILAICDDGIKYNTASVCIPASFVRTAADYVKGKIAICTVIGFPNGYTTTAAKCFEAADAIQNGADEIDMVVNLTLVRDGKFDEVRDEIAAVKKVCGDKILKVIIETCLLTDEEKIKMCAVVAEAGADFIKTSTGFSKGGATREDVALMAANCPPDLKIKAAGGIRSFADAEDFISLGATRLGTSALVKLMKAEALSDY
ncbi:MAG: deoxyribose-phosphate aldolase [Clostridia bacterium]|nr:deoxyribose-phosphate aldolase [Clostridia bacterium]